MRFAPRRSAIAGLAGVLLAAQLGCAARAMPVAPPQGKPQLGTIGLASPRFVPPENFSTPGAVRGVGQVVGYWAEAVGRAGQFGIFVLPALPVFALAGAILGAVEAPSGAAVRAAETSLRTALAEARVQEVVRNHVARLAREETGHPLVVLAAHGPAALGQEIDYRMLAGAGVDTVLEVSVVGVELERYGPQRADPQLQLVVVVGARLLRVVDGALLHQRAFVYRGETRPFLEWAADGARPFREDLARVPKVLGWSLVRELLCVTPAKLKGDPVVRFVPGSPMAHVPVSEWERRCG